MKLDKLIHWRLEGTPDVFTETRDGEEWQVIHSGGAIHDAGFLQTVRFDRPIKSVTLSACVSLFSPGGKLALRLGIGPYSDLPPQSRNITWGSWYAPENEWVASQPGWIQYKLDGLETDQVTVFLQSKCLYPVKANTSRWRDVQIQVEYVGIEPEPPGPDPDPDTPEAIRTLQKAMALSSQLLEQAGKMTLAIGQVLELFDEEPEV